MWGWGDWKGLEPVFWNAKQLRLRIKSVEIQYVWIFATSIWFPFSVITCIIHELEKSIVSDACLCRRYLIHSCHHYTILFESHFSIKIEYSCQSQTLASLHAIKLFISNGIEGSIGMKINFCKNLNQSIWMTFQ